MSGHVLLAGVVLLALVFDFTNGFHDTANAVATSVSTRALTPRAALALAAVMNFAGAFASTAVAATIATGIIETGAETNLEIIASALIGATAWNLATWYLALPSSSSYALIGGLIGPTLIAYGSSAVDWRGIVFSVVLPAVLAPLAGFAVAFAVLALAGLLLRHARLGPANRGFRVAQIGAGSLMGFAHGANDAQKTMGVIALALLADGVTPSFQVPTWVKVASAAALALGTYAGGWRIMRTIGYRVYRLEPPHGFAAQTAATSVLFSTAAAGLPVSTTHVITGAVFGAGSAGRSGRVRWSLAVEILAGWILTLPAAAAVAAFVYAPYAIFS
jgi:PiT family inorganic phosphate transporter